MRHCLRGGSHHARAGRSGSYKVDLLPGSPPIASVSASRKGYDTNFKAKVTGKGRKRTLVYDARRRGGLSVTFAERGPDVFKRIGTVKGGKGRIRFTPGLGRGGTRTIIAIATLDGTPIPEQTLARYRAPGVVKTGRPRKVRARRRGRTLRISWKAAKGAKRYGIVVSYSNGKQRIFEVGSKRRKLRVRGVPLTEGGVVRVNAQGALLDWGKSRRARFRRLKRPATVLQTNRFNEKKTAQRKEKQRKAKQRKRSRRKKR